MRISRDHRNTGQQVFTVCEVYAEMLAAGTRYAESTVFKTMQRMKAPAGRAPWIVSGYPPQTQRPHLPGDSGQSQSSVD